MIRDRYRLLERLRAVHAAIRDAIAAACLADPPEARAAVVGEEGGDTIFAIDRVSEATLLAHFDALAEEWPHVLIAEGLGTSGQVVLPRGSDPARAELRIIVDPIDGTRGLMYDKRPAWILTGVAPNHGPGTSLADIELALQTEIPLPRQYLSDAFWAVAGEGVGGERRDRLTGATHPLAPRPSRATTIAQGYGGIARFFPGGRDELAAVEEALIRRVLGTSGGRALTFEDQYISTGGQLYELIMGHDRWLADLRPLLRPVLQRRGQWPIMCCHPYDLCTELIAREAGVIITDERGRRIAAPLDVHSSVAWIGYANAAIRAQVEPALRLALRERGLLPPTATPQVV
ncbi:inositol monophosphatase [Kallotenue papyrolyticum]|uniref:inositol monophosphatase n=1 Tax=Kallotenue papyrolyticum TaxID=1325125 RepID=UPI0004924753|nr:inositol monophosphatase [Kallotenue papyrolyticum]